MPELTKSSVGSFAGTSELEGTMLWPFDRKYSRKLERISLDFMRPFYCSASKSPGRRGRLGRKTVASSSARRLARGLSGCCVGVCYAAVCDLTATNPAKLSEWAQHC